MHANNNLVNAEEPICKKIGQMATSVIPTGYMRVGRPPETGLH